MPTTITRTTHHPDATAALGFSLALLCAPGDILLLRGELGAGKTALARGIATGVGLAAAAISSPTFVVMHVHSLPHIPSLPGPHATNITPVPRPTHLLHIDAYRLASHDELENIGWDRFFDPISRFPTSALAIIEWPGNIAPALPPADRCIDISLSHADIHSRTLIITLPDSLLARFAPPNDDLLNAFINRPPLQCPTTRRWVPPTTPTYPFIDVRAQNADLYRWLAPPDDEPDPETNPQTNPDA